MMNLSLARRFSSAAGFLPNPRTGNDDSRKAETKTGSEPTVFAGLPLVRKADREPGLDRRHAGDRREVLPSL